MNATRSEFAREFAVAAHGEQMYGAQLYVYHLDAVADIVRIYGDDAVTIAYLHDVIEDTDTSEQSVGRAFGSYIAYCVACLTDEAGSSRRERKEKTNRKLAELTSTYNVALIVKAADRLANLRESSRSNPDKLAMYNREHAAFQAAACRPGLCDELWAEMDEILAVHPS